MVQVHHSSPSSSLCQDLLLLGEGSTNYQKISWNRIDRLTSHVGHLSTWHQRYTKSNSKRTDVCRLRRNLCISHSTTLDVMFLQHLAAHTRSSATGNHYYGTFVLTLIISSLGMNARFTFTHITDFAELYVHEYVLLTKRNQIAVGYLDTHTGSTQILMATVYRSSLKGNTHENPIYHSHSPLRWSCHS